MEIPLSEMPISVALPPGEIKFACPWCGSLLEEDEKDRGVAFCPECRNLIGHLRMPEDGRQGVVVWKIAKYCYLTLGGYCLLHKRHCAQREGLADGCKNCACAIEHLEEQLRLR